VPVPLDEPGRIHGSRYRLTVVADSVADVVGSAGGWLCDRARAGWDVSVVLTETADTRPLTILGAGAVDGRLLDAVRTAAAGGVLAVSAALLARDERVRAQVRTLVQRGIADVMVWGDEWRSDDDRVEHSLSAAARAFKTSAARALGAAEPVSCTETLTRLSAESLRPLYAV
jgi:hypothetical protein